MNNDNNDNNNNNKNNNNNNNNINNNKNVVSLMNYAALLITSVVQPLELIPAVTGNA